LVFGFGIQAPDLGLMGERNFAYTRCIRYHVLQAFSTLVGFTLGVSCRSFLMFPVCLFEP
jgi:hypothetical protein